MTTAARVTAEGQQAIKTFLDEKLLRPRLASVGAWCQEAEFMADSGYPPQIEISEIDSRSGHVETLVLKDGEIVIDEV